jgi:ferredoxin
VIISTGSMNFGAIVARRTRAMGLLRLVLAAASADGVPVLHLALAETNRPPFDLPEAESELVAGYQVEYSSTPFLLFMAGEYIAIFLMCALMTLLFFGGWLSPIPGLPDGALWMVAKMAFFFFLFAMVKAIVPRYRYDQLMRIGWKVFLPLSLAWVVFVAFPRSSKCSAGSMPAGRWEADHDADRLLDPRAKYFLLQDMLKGLRLGLKYFFAPKATLNYPHEKGPLAPRFRGEHALRRYPNGEERCIACKLCEAICPAQAITIDAEPREDGSPPHHALRHRHDEVHLLRLLPGGLPGRCHRRGPEFRIRHRDPRRAVLRQGQALENGERWEAEIARNLEWTRPTDDRPRKNPFEAMFRQTAGMAQEMGQGHEPGHGAVHAQGFRWTRCGRPCPRRCWMAFWGKQFNPDGLDAKTRLLLTLQGLTMQGARGRGADPPDRAPRASRRGATKQEIAETIGRWPRCSAACRR